MTLYEETIASLAKIKGGIPVKNLSSRERVGEHKSVFRDQGMDFHQLREYDPDRDPVNRIAWNLSAQPGDDLWVREAIETKDTPTVLLADLSSSIDFGMNGELSKRKLLLECTGILALSAAHVQDRVGLVGFTDKIVIDEPAKTGADHAYYLISRLCAFLEQVPARERRGTDLLAAFAHVRERYAGSILAIVLSD
ncbi:MAG TPA: DUF58 domain-containing protein, partial [Candidatus Paceibacterota bacterium]|nr:DUF58 domain-containing protein [Candidatus Paceibacterota bacterium]